MATFGEVEFASESEHNCYSRSTAIGFIKHAIGRQSMNILAKILMLMLGYTVEVMRAPDDGELVFALNKGSYGGDALQKELSRMAIKDLLENGE